MENKNPIITYLPEFMREYGDIKSIVNTEQIEINSLWNRSERSLLNNYVEDTDVFGISRWEKVVRIVPRADETLDERKFAIKAKINEELPYTYNALIKKLDSICGKYGYAIAIMPNAYQVEVKVELTAKNNFDTVKKMLRKILPANIICVVDLKYNQHITLHVLTNAQLKTKTNNALRNEVI